ncbi:MAG: glycosyltransferase [Patescibacteria group bacterium]
MPNPLVSILMPTYKPDARYLREAVESVLAQTYPHWTLLVNDEPTDVDARAAIQPYLRDPRIRCAQNATRLGIGGNWNACLREAHGEIIQYLFQDDVWDPAYLARGVEALTRERNVGIVALAHEYRSDDSPEAVRFLREAGYEGIREARVQRLPRGTEEGKSFLRRWLKMGLRPNLVGEPSFVMLHRSVTDRLGAFREDLPQGLDLEYWVRVLLVTDLHAVAEPSGFFRVHPKAASMSNDAAGAGLFDRLHCFKTLLRLSPPDLRKEVQAALVEQLSLMGGKYRSRMRGGRNTGGSAILRLLPFVLRHPWLFFRAALRLLKGKAS